MRRISIPIILLLLSVFSTGCRKEREADEEFVAGKDIELWVNSSLIHRYDPLTWQLSFNRDRVEYKVFDDMMSKYYSLTLDKLPLEKDQVVKGTVSWTTPRSSMTKRDLSFTVVKTDALGTVWLWNGKEKIGISVRTIR